MNKVVHKAFPLWDWEKEAAWLNEMSRQGWQLCRVGWCRKERPGLYRLSGGHRHPGGGQAVQLGLSAA